MRTQCLQRIGNQDKEWLHSMAHDDGIPAVALLHILVTKEWEARKEEGDVVVHGDSAEVSLATKSGPAGTVSAVCQAVEGNRS